MIYRLVHLFTIFEPDNLKEIKYDKNHAHPNSPDR